MDECKWVENINETTNPAPPCGNPAPSADKVTMEGKGREGKGIEQKGTEEPLTPSAEGGAKAEPVVPVAKGPLQLRAEKLMRRGVDTPLTAAEARAFTKNRACLEATSEPDWLALEAYYAAPQSETYSRKDLGALLNNWNGEIDRAKAWTANPGAGRADRLKELDRAARELIGLGKLCDHDRGDRTHNRILELRPQVEALRAELGVIA
jgi:hypothetical protein